MKINADDNKDDNTRNGNRFLTPSLTFDMKGLNVSEVSKRYKPQNVWDNRYETTEPDEINIHKKPCKSY